MAEENKKSGAGKFFLGAALGALAGAVASKFISTNKEEDWDEETADGEEGDKCECKKDCPRAKEEAKKPETRKATEKKTTEKKTSEKK